MRPPLPSDLRTALSGSLLDSLIEEKPHEERAVLREAKWMLTNTRYGKTHILKQLNHQFHIPQARCERIMVSTFGRMVFQYRNKRINGRFISELENG